MVDEERARAAALLGTQHSFPGPFGLRVVIVPEAQPVVEAVVAATEGVTLLDVEVRESSRGRWRSLRLSLQAETAEAVLDAYAALRGVEGVVVAL
mgnify:CR=1 FL=1